MIGGLDWRVLLLAMIAVLEDKDSVRGGGWWRRAMEEEDDCEGRG
jgi:hypothetical protein